MERPAGVTALRSAGRLVGKYWNWRLFLKHYVYPALDRRERILYDPREMFGRTYARNLDAEGFGDGLTLGSKIDPLHTRYHYAGIEMSIIELLIFRGYPANPAVLDVGTGTGHWIDFYLRTFAARQVTGLDIAEPIIAK